MTSPPGAIPCCRDFLLKRAASITLISIPARVNAALTQRLLQRGPEEKEVGCSSGHDGPFCDVDDHSGLELE